MEQKFPGALWKGAGGQFVRENSHSKAEVESTEWSVAMRLTVREQKTASMMET